MVKNVKRSMTLNYFLKLTKPTIFDSNNPASDNRGILFKSTTFVA